MENSNYIAPIETLNIEIDRQLLEKVWSALCQSGRTHNLLARAGEARNCYSLADELRRLLADASDQR